LLLLLLVVVVLLPELRGSCCHPQLQQAAPPECQPSACYLQQRLLE